LKILTIVFFWLAALNSNIQASSQNYFKAYQEKLNAAIDVVDIKGDVDILIESCKKDLEYLEAAQIASDYGVTCYLAGVFDLSIDYLRREISIYDQLEKYDPAYIKANYRLGVFLRSDNQFAAAEAPLQKATSIKPATVYSGYAYGVLSKHYQETGDFEKSEDTFRRAITMLQQFDNTSQIVGKSLDLVRLYRMSYLPKAREKTKKILEDLEQNYTPFQGYNYLRYYTALGNYYNNDIGKIDSTQARRNFHKVLKYARQIENTQYIHHSYNNLAFLSVNIKSDSSQYYLSKSLETSQNKEDSISSHLNASTYYYDKKNLDVALERIHSALELQLDTIFSIADLPSQESLQSQLGRDFVVQFLSIKASVIAQMGYSNDDVSKVKIALDHFNLADVLIDKISKSSRHTNTKLALRELASTIYASAIEASAYVNNFEKAVYFAEKNKAITLIENLKRSEELKQLPKQLYDRELYLKSKIERLNYRLESSSKTESRTILSELLNAKNVYHTYIDSLESTGFLKKDNTANTIKSLAEIQHLLNQEQCILSYTWDRENVYTSEPQLLVIGKEKVQHVSLGNSKVLDSLLTLYRTSIETPFYTANDKAQFYKTSYTLYNTLIPEQLRTSISSKKLIIIPDSNLQYIPFEALITNPTNGRYLIEENDLSYIYSSSFWLSSHTLSRKRTKHKLIGIAPVNFAYDNLPSLTNSREEVAQIAEVMQGISYVDTAATTTSFLEAFKAADIVHLATHAQSSDHPWIAFRDRKLQASELYNLQNSADLVVLSACETALGEEARGEGVMNLARGFFAGGARSVVSTFWSVNDKTSTLLMQDFYKFLEEGYSKSEALRKTKRNYLSTHKLSEKSPYYWASFNLVGDFDPILNQGFNGQNIWVMGIIIVLVLLLGFTFFKKK